MDSSATNNTCDCSYSAFAIFVQLESEARLDNPMLDETLQLIDRTKLCHRLLLNCRHCSKNPFCLAVLSTLTSTLTQAIGACCEKHCLGPRMIHSPPSCKAFIGAHELDQSEGVMLTIELFSIRLQDLRMAIAQTEKAVKGLTSSSRNATLGACQKALDESLKELAKLSAALEVAIAEDEGRPCT